MKSEVPKIAFNPASKKTVHFEIIPIEKIAKNRKTFDHDPEQPHQIKFYNLIFYTKGSGKHFIDFNWHAVNQNSLVYVAKEQINAFQFSEGLEGFCMVFTETYLTHCFPNLPKDFTFRLFSPQIFSPIVQIPNTSDFGSYFELLLKEYNALEENKKTIIDALFVILVSKAEQVKQQQTQNKKSLEKIKLFQKFMNRLELQNSKNRSAQFYAQELGVSYKHLNETCKTLLNKTAKTIITDFIVLQAKRSLINSSIKSTELAYQLGFEEPTNFTKYFKKNTGFTPKQFIKSLKKE
ncbi:MAG: helix-turn-helix domain-containing protein [Bacteroidota bacterium]